MKCKMPRNFLDETSNKYGRLFVLKRASNSKTGFARWLCRCDCGNQSVVVGVNLRSGVSRSCGCYRRDRCCIPMGQASLNLTVRRMRGSAKHRNIGWVLSLDEAKDLIVKSCYYCGIRPSQKGVSRRGINGISFYNGIDRVNNLLGYSIDNVVSCCKRCNAAKSAMTIDEFRELINNIYKNFVKRK